MDCLCSEGSIKCHCVTSCKDFLERLAQLWWLPPQFLAFEPSFPHCSLHLELIHHQVLDYPLLSSWDADPSSTDCFLYGSDFHLNFSNGCCCLSLILNFCFYFSNYPFCQLPLRGWWKSGPLWGLWNEGSSQSWSVTSSLSYQSSSKSLLSSKGYFVTVAFAIVCAQHS